ncbi:sensor histidine kinase [Variovorax sp. M-6]|uniref:sensor histidine kinase n=1 Tax=Variovorax sp. M-6 TaxID=3233041 RepID=UPI003F95E932
MTQDAHEAGSLDHWPDAALMLDQQGRVAVANAAARRHWQCSGEQLRGQDADRLLHGLRWHGTGAPMLPRAALRASPRPVVGEGEDAEGRGLLLRCLPLFDDNAGHRGWLVVLIDITPMRQAERQRDEALRFLAHDARESGATILALLDLARQRPEAFADGSLLPIVEREAQAGLERSDGFVALARAQARPLQVEPLDLIALLRLVVDAAWALAARQRVRILLPSVPDEAPCLADRGLLTRALDAMLDHALQRAPPGSALHCGVAADGPRWRISLREPTAGAPVRLQSRLVRTVAQRHGGTMEIDHAADAGCTVTLVLPKPSTVERAAPASDTES